MYLVDKLLPQNETAVLYGDGGSGKSLVALWVAHAVATGGDLPAGLRVRLRAPVLYLDWESRRSVHEGRLHALMAGIGATETGRLEYRRMTRGLADDVAVLRAAIARRGVGLVVVDSFGLACGNEPETADSAIRLAGAIRSLETTALVVAHVNRQQADSKAPARPFGSVYVQNLSRASWEIRRTDEPLDDEQDEMVLGLFHRKTNARRHPAIGLRVQFCDDGATRIEAVDPRQEPSLADRLSLGHRIVAALGDGAADCVTLADRLDVSQASVRGTLNRLRARRLVVKLPPVTQDGKRRNALWGLSSKG